MFVVNDEIANANTKNEKLFTILFMFNLYIIEYLCLNININTD